MSSFVLPSVVIPLGTCVRMQGPNRLYVVGCLMVHGQWSEQLRSYMLKITILQEIPIIKYSATL